MVIHTRVAFIGAVMCALFPACVSSTKYVQLQDELAAAQDELDATRGALLDAEGEMMRMQDDRVMLESQAAQAARLQAELNELRERYALTEIDGASTVFDPQSGMLGYEVKDDLLFASGSANISTEGERVLKQVAAQLSGQSEPIRIDGHTDSDPVNKTKDQWPQGNIQLGAGRAIAVREALIKFGIEPKRMNIMSYADNRPRADGNSAEAKAKNRRVEILFSYRNNG